MAVLSLRVIVGVTNLASPACGASKLNCSPVGTGGERGEVPEHPDLQDEQEFLNRAYDGLEFMRGEARQMLQGVLDLGRGGTFQSRTERDIVVRTSASAGSPRPARHRRPGPLLRPH